MLGIILSLLVAFLKSLGELAGKIFVTKNSSAHEIDEYTLALGGRLLGFFLIIPFIFFIDFGSFIISPGYILIALSSAICNTITTITALKAVKYGDLSLVGPLTSLTIPFLLLSGFIFLGEVPNIYGFIGICFIFIGSYFLQIREIKNGILGPIKAIYRNIGARYMLITSMLWSISTPLDKLGISQYGVLGWIVISSTLIGILMSLYIYIYHSQSFGNLNNKKALQKISIMTLIGGIMLILQMFALKLTLAIYVISIKRASGIFSVFLGALFFKEKNIFSKLIAASIMLSGVAVITIFGNI